MVYSEATRAQFAEEIKELIPGKRVAEKGSCDIFQMMCFVKDDGFIAGQHFSVS